jgi:hypothetical protein
MISNSLSMACRPYMQFDVENIEHRRYVSEFLKTMSWKNCPYQWRIDDSSLNLYHYFQKKLLEHYMKTDVEICDVKVENQRVFKFRK